MLNLIANELKSIGFQTQITSATVIVSLNRPMNQMEVEIALNQIFDDEIRFSISRINKNSFSVK